MLATLFVATCAGYWAIDRWSHPFLGLLAELSLQFVLYGLWVARLRQGNAPSIRLIVTTALLSRLVLWFSQPVLENDFWRYLWDGRVLAHGINPYLYAPLDATVSALDIGHLGYRKHIGWGQYGTIYPPLAELLFGVTHLAAPDSLLGLKAMLTVFDLGTGWVLMRWLSVQGRDPRWALLYLLNPLVLKEIANSAHLDSIPVFFTLLALYWMSTCARKSFGAWVLLALGACSKLYPLVLVPLFIRVDPRWKRHMGVFLVTFGALYLPFIGAGLKLLGGTSAYAKYWIFNAGVFQITTLALNSVFERIALFTMNPFVKEALKNDFPAKLLLGSAFVFLVFARTRRLSHREELPRASLSILGLLLIVSPVVDPWYVLWVLPLACLLENLPWILFTYLVVGSYAWFYSKQLAPFFRITEYSLFFLSFLVAWMRNKRCTALRSKESCSSPQASL